MDAHVRQLALHEDQEAAGAKDVREALHELGVVGDVHDHGLDVDEVWVSSLHVCLTEGVVGPWEGLCDVYRDEVSIVAQLHPPTV